MFTINENLTNNCFYHDRIEFDYVFNKLLFLLYLITITKHEKRNNIYFI